MITLNAIAKRIEQFATNHFFIKSYSFGSPDDVDLDKFQDFPLMHVVYTGSDYDERTKTFSFEVYVFDRPNREEQMTINQREVVSDAQMCLEDVIADIANGGNIFLFDEDYEVTTAGITPLIDERSNLLTGALLDLTIQVPYQRDACNLPIDGVSPEGGEFAYQRRGILRVRTQSGDVDVLSVNEIRVTNGTLTDEGEGVVSLSITGGAGGAVNSVNGIAPVDGDVSLNSDDIPEGETNLYYTNERVQAHLESGNVDQINLTNNAVFSWNETDGAVDIAYANGVTLQVGQEEHFYAKATEAIADGDVVMFAGAEGSHLLIRKADASVIGFLPEWVIGVATQDFALNEFGYVTSFGKVRGLDTSGWAEGALLWLDPDNAGQLVNSEPTPPDHIILIAANVYQHQQQGTLFVRISHKSDTDETPEGTTNLYYTDARVDARVTALGLATTTYVDTEVGNEESARIAADSALETQITTNAGNIATLDGEAVKNVNGVVPSAGAVTIDTDDIAQGTTNLYYPAADASKLAGIEAGAEVNVNADWNATSGDAQILNKPTLAAVATSGAYGDLSGTPTIPDQFFEVKSTASTAYTLDASDAGRYLTFTASSAVAVTIPFNVFQIDTEIVMEQSGTGQVTISAAGGVTLNNSSSNTTKTAERYAVVALKCTANNTWTLTGERELV